MIVLDTNVVSELMRPAPNAQVRDWLQQSEQRPCVSVVTIMEITYGIARLPAGARRNELAAAWQQLRERLSESTVAISDVVGVNAALLRAERQAAGRPLHLADALIAGTCVEHRATLATRNADDFVGLGIDVVNPWSNG